MYIDYNVERFARHVERFVRHAIHNKYLLISVDFYNILRYNSIDRLPKLWLLHLSKLYIHKELTFEEDSSSKFYGLNFANFMMMKFRVCNFSGVLST